MEVLDLKHVLLALANPQLLWKDFHIRILSERGDEHEYRRYTLQEARDGWEVYLPQQRRPVLKEEVEQAVDVLIAEVAVLKEEAPPFSCPDLGVGKECPVVHQDLEYGVLVVRGLRIAPSVVHELMNLQLVEKPQVQDLPLLG